MTLVLPEVADAQRTTGEAALRYEDVAQDGRVLPAALPSALGVVWRELLSRVPAGRQLRK